METKIHWYKKWYESQYQLFSGDQQIGEISPVAFSSKTIACMNGKKYIFRPEAFLLHKIDIYDSATMERTGKIYFKGWGIRGVITINTGESFQLRCSNLFTGHWAILRNHREILVYTGNYMEGHIRTDLSHPVLVLAGLYASIFQWRKLILLLIIIIPLILILIRTL